MKKLFTDTAWEDYAFWLESDVKTLKKIHRLLKDIDRSPFDGLGKPEALKFELQGYWSRRVNETDRLIYTCERLKIPTAFAVGQRKQVLPARVYGKFKCSPVYKVESGTITVISCKGHYNK